MFIYEMMIVLLIVFLILSKFVLIRDVISGLAGLAVNDPKISSVTYR